VPQPDDLAARILAEVDRVVAIPDDEARVEGLEAIAEDLFAAAYDMQVSDDSPPLEQPDLERFTGQLSAALTHTTDEADSATVAGWIASAAWNAATVAAAPPGFRFTWRTQRDDAVRDIHVPLEGVSQPPGGTFLVAGSKLRYPGEPVGPPSVWINCRCYLDLDQGLTAAAATKGVAVVATVNGEERIENYMGRDGGDQRHVTIGYYGDASGNLALKEQLQEWLDVESIDDPAVTVGGIGRLGDDEPQATVMFVESPELARLRSSLEQVAVPDGKHPHFTPHVTVGYGIDMPDTYPKTLELGGLEVWWGDEVMSAATDDDDDYLMARTYDTDKRKQMADRGTAMPDGSYPIADEEDLRNAIQAIGRAKDPDAVKRHIRKRARALGLTDLIPDSWTASVVAAPVPKPADTHDAPGWLTHPRETERLRRYWTKGEGAAKIRWGTPGDLTRCEKHLRKYVGPQWSWQTCNNLHHVVFGFFNPESGHRKGSIEEDTLMLPPRKLFENPQLKAPTPMTIVADGEFLHYFGHLATWDQCHVGFGEDNCTPPPRSNANYAYFRTGEVETDGGLVAVGHVTVGIGHAEEHLGARETVAHYDNTEAVGADIAAGEDQFGIWGSGIVRPGISDNQLYALRAGAPSGDWRRIGGNLELVGALIVNVPGFPVPRPKLTLAASGVPISLIAANVVVDPNAQLADVIEIALDRHHEKRERIDEAAALTAAVDQIAAARLCDEIKDLLA
jgi:hypothetical protein